MTSYSRRLCLLVVAVFAALPAALAQPKGPGQKGGLPSGPLTGGLPIVDTHCHLMGKGGPRTDFEGAARVALATMDQLGVRKALVMPPPQPPNFRQGYEANEFLAAIRQHPTRFAYLAGGGSLNVMIEEARGSATVSPQLRARFEAKADELIKSGAVGFGEMTALHVSHFSGHPFEEVAADHPLFLLLADLAAKHGVPIDLHMECVPKDMPAPAKLSAPPNPKSYRANLPAFERLLAHNRAARIVWVHFGADHTGHWTVALVRELLTRHPNLHLSLRVNPPGLPENSPLTDDRRLKPDWAALFKDFPDRFMLGSDVFYVAPSLTGQHGFMPPQGSILPLKAMLPQLPPDVARKLASENAVRIYKLKD